MSTIIEWYKNGGWIMNFILAVGVAGIAIFIERFYTIVIKSKINGRAFIERVISLVRAGKIDDAIKLCAQSTAALPDMGLLILRSRSDAKLPFLRVAADEGGFAIDLPQSWLEDNPLSADALDAEAGQWKKVGMKLEVSGLSDKKVSVLQQVR